MATDISATTTITFEQLTKYFHLPINDVAKELGICATMLKKICRKNGIPRWPHRKIKSLNKMIENLEASLQNNASEAEECIRQEINILKNKKSLIMKNPSILVQGNKRSSQDADGKVVKKLRTDDDMPVATVTVPRSSLLPPSSSSSSSSLSINQLLTPSNPFSTPLTSYLMAGEDKDEKESPRRGDEIQMMRPPSPNTQHYYKTSVQQSPMQQATSRYYLPQEYSHRAGTDYLSSQPSYVQQPPTSTQDSHYVLPKLNFSSNNATQPTTSYMTSSPPKFRPPSPINSSHQLQHQQPSYAPASPDSYSRHYFHHYHPQLSSPATPYKMQYSQQPQQSQQVAMPQQMIAQQSASGAPVVLRWVMEYDKSKK